MAYDGSQHRKSAAQDEDQDLSPEIRDYNHSYNDMSTRQPQLSPSPHSLYGDQPGKPSTIHHEVPGGFVAHQSSNSMYLNLTNDESVYNWQSLPPMQKSYRTVSTGRSEGYQHQHRLQQSLGTPIQQHSPVVSDSIRRLSSSPLDCSSRGLADRPPFSLSSISKEDTGPTNKSSDSNGQFTGFSAPSQFPLHHRDSSHQDFNAYAMPHTAIHSVPDAYPKHIQRDSVASSKPAEKQDHNLIARESTKAKSGMAQSNDQNRETANNERAIFRPQTQSHPSFDSETLPPESVAVRHDNTQRIPHEASKYSSLVPSGSYNAEQPAEDVQAVFEQFLRVRGQDSARSASLMEEPKTSQPDTDESADSKPKSSLTNLPAGLGRAPKSANISRNMQSQINKSPHVATSSPVPPEPRKSNIGKPVHSNQISANARDYASAGTEKGVSSKPPIGQSSENQQPPHNMPRAEDFSPRPNIGQHSTASPAPPNAVTIDRRRAIASRAKETLESVPQNQGRSISTDYIQDLFSQNPSYEQLCVILEQQGWKFDRGAFARALSGEITNSSSRVFPQASSGRLMSGSHSTDDVGHDDFPLDPELRDSTTAGVSQPNVQFTDVRDYNQAPARVNDTLAIEQIELPAVTSSVPAKTIKSSLRVGDYREPSDKTGPKISIMADLTNQGASANDGTDQTKASSLGGVNPDAHPVAPRNKKEAARKRTFAEFVDLHEVDEDDDEVQAALEEARKRAATNDSTERFVEKPMAEITQKEQSPWEKAASRYNRFKNQKPQAGITSARESLRHEHIVQTINTDTARRTNHYNPRTIARDFFLAKGEHPTMSPLNWHLESLYNTFKSVRLESDLSTIRWDLIDPGEPMLLPGVGEQKKMEESGINPPEERQNQSLEAKPAERSNMGDQGDVDGMIWPVNITKGEPADLSFGHTADTKVDTSPVSAQRVRTRGETGYRGSGGTIRRPRGRPRGRPSRGSRGASQRPAAPHDIRANIPTATPTTFAGFPSDSASTGEMTSGNSHNAVDLSAEGLESPPLATRPRISHHGESALPSASEERMTSGRATPSTSTSSTLCDKHGTPAKIFASGKRVGRPPGKNRGFATPGAVTSNSLSPLARGSDGNGVKRRGRPPGSRGASTRGRPSNRGIRGRVRSSRAAPQKHYRLQVHTTMPADGVAVQVPEPGPVSLTPSFEPVDASFEYDPAIISRQRDRTYGKDDSFHHPHPHTYHSPDKFPIFQCEWRGCTSKLHNLKTLSKHIHRVHLATYNRNPDEPVKCLWSSCCSADYIFSDHQNSEEHPEYLGRPFDSIAELEDHIQDAHLRQVAENQGDGPTVRPRLVDPATFLCDPKTGAVVTPSALAFGSGPPDPLLPVNHENGDEFVRAYHKAHGNLTKASKIRAKLYSGIARANDERNFESQSNRVARQWKQMDMIGVRVEMPLSTATRKTMGLPEATDLDTALEFWRDPDREEEKARRRTELMDRKRRFEYFQSTSESEEDGWETQSKGQVAVRGFGNSQAVDSASGEGNGDRPAMFTSPGRVSMGRTSLGSNPAKFLAKNDEHENENGNTDNKDNKNHDNENEIGNDDNDNEEEDDAADIPDSRSPAFASAGRASRGRMAPSTIRAGSIRAGANSSNEDSDEGAIAVIPFRSN